MWTRGIGADVFTATATPSCPPGQHWVPDPVAPIRGLSGIGVCVANAPLVLHLRPPATAAPATAPAPLPPPMMAPPVVDASSPAPQGGDAAAAPEPTPPPALVCPPPWPWWYLVVAAGVGGALGYYAQRNQKSVRRNARAAASHAGHRIVRHASDAAISRALR
jgi:hypothetical protein